METRENRQEQSEAPGRREAHKAATRKALHDAARRLFEERGYERTTVRDIAAAACVTERTFFRYFPSKEDLVLGEILDLIPVMADLVRKRPTDEPPYTALLHATLDLIKDQGLGVMFSGPPRNLPGQPTRQSRAILGQFEDGIAEALAERLGGQRPPSPDTALRAAVLSRAAIGATRAALAAYSALPDDRQNPTTALELLQAAFAHLKE
ncbi:TetR family transcriptional regulator [Streptomyces sp. NPDC050095]|uniref:TetR family transcriptional regulator n=1 Tax=unclassified Streptomyces TaxID=2593676 RepID=UPI00341E8474